VRNVAPAMILLHERVEPLAHARSFFRSRGRESHRDEIYRLSPSEPDDALVT
jgi:hypothetical protein